MFKKLISCFIVVALMVSFCVAISADSLGGFDNVWTDYGWMEGYIRIVDNVSNKSVTAETFCSGGTAPKITSTIQVVAYPSGASLKSKTVSRNNASSAYASVAVPLVPVTAYSAHQIVGPAGAYVEYFSYVNG